MNDFIELPETRIGTKLALHSLAFLEEGYMKYAKLLMVFLVITLFGVFQLGCGGGSSGTVADDGGDDPVVVDDSVTTLTSGMEDVATDAVLEYTFDTAQDPDSVTTSTVYLVPRGTTASANLSADFDLSVDDYSYSNDCDVESAMSGISVESEDGTSVTITSSYEYMGGGIFALCIDGEESIVIFSTEGDLETDCAALFDGESCTYDAELDEGSLSYDVLAAAMEGNADGLAAFCIYGAGLGDSDCLEEESVETIMALFGDEESEDEHLTWGDESADSEEVFLVEGLDGDSQVFTMQGVNLDDEETWGANPYMLYADTGDTTDILRAELGWLYDEFAGTEVGGVNPRRS